MIPYREYYYLIVFVRQFELDSLIVLPTLAQFKLAYFHEQSSSCQEDFSALSHIRHPNFVDLVRINSRLNRVLAPVTHHPRIVRQCGRRRRETSEPGCSIPRRCNNTKLHIKACYLFTYKVFAYLNTHLKSKLTNWQANCKWKFGF